MIYHFPFKEGSFVPVLYAHSNAESGAYPVKTTPRNTPSACSPAVTSQLVIPGGIAGLVMSAPEVAE